MLSFSRRHILATIAVLPIGGCGFEPVYGTGKAASALAGKLQIEEKNGRKEFEFRDRLQQRIDRCLNILPSFVKLKLFLWIPHLKTSGLRQQGQLDC